MVKRSLLTSARKTLGSNGQFRGTKNLVFFVPLKSIFFLRLLALSGCYPEEQLAEW